VSKGADLRFRHATELLVKLTRTVADFARQESELTSVLSARSRQEIRRHREEAHKVDAALEGELAEVESVAAKRAERVQAICDHRLGRVQRAHGLLTRTLPKRAADAKGNWLAKLQMRKLTADRELAANTKRNDAEHAALSQTLAQHRAVLDSLAAQAKSAFSGYGSFAQTLVERDAEKQSAEASEDFLGEIEARIAAANEQLAKFRSLSLPRLFSAIPLAVWITLAIAVGGATCFVRGFSSPLWIAGASVAVLLVAGCVAAYVSGKSGAQDEAARTGASILDAFRALRAGFAAADSRYKAGQKRIQEEYDGICADVDAKWTAADGIEEDFGEKGRRKLDPQLPRMTQKMQARLTRQLAEFRARADAKKKEFEDRAAAGRANIDAAHQAEMAVISANEQERWATLDAAWKEQITPIFAEIAALNSALAPDFPEWSAQFIEAWKPYGHFTPATRFAQFQIDLAKRADASTTVSRLALPGAPQVSIPLALTFPQQGSLLLETKESCGGATMSVLNNVMLRLLTTTPPGKIAFTIIDPVGLGENFAGFMHLGDYEEAVINRRIWTQRDQIDERLAELNAHIEKVIQMYLRNEYANITAYNEQAGTVAEKYLFLIVADFPNGFSEASAQRLQSIAISGPRCGVFTLIHWDQRQPLPDGFAIDELRKGSVCLRADGAGFSAGREQTESGAALVLDPPPDDSLPQKLVHKIGKSSVDSNRVQVPFSQIAPKPEELWTNETTNELRIAIGRTGATKQQYLAIGKGTRQHALFAGKTGSGKSTLFHVIITNLALACSPDQVEFYLIDFKKGVEFKCYANKRLPHARVVAIESDREFALSVLQRVDEELKRRGDLFRKLNVQDVAGYKRAGDPTKPNGGLEPMPRSLLLIDEFQEFFVEDDNIAQTASLLFDRIVRQGRAFGIHVILGSQTLGGAFTLARATMGQMVIRVALQCNEADAYLIMDDTNSAPRLLSRPGEGIYNDAAGAVEGNSPFQVVWLSDEERDACLDKVRALAEQRHLPPRSAIVFEGNAPASVQENDLLAVALETKPLAAPPAPRCWFGAPNSIKGPTEVIFHRQSGNHMLIVGQREESALTMVILSVIALAAQHPAGSARFIVIHAAVPGTPDAEQFDRLAKTVPHGLTLATALEIPDVMRDLATEMKSRASGETPLAGAPSVFVFIHGLHKFKKLRHEDEFSFGGGDGEASPGAAFNEIITEGSALGIHIIATLDSYNNLNRAMSRKALTEFEMRIVFQMSANDSASLIDSPKASNLGLHRALLHNEQAGTIETFRPYAAPDSAWFEHVAAQLAAR
jgi:S-DNA-T family DNA segregation ATPase FtsK/SpoIIIE